MEFILHNSTSVWRLSVKRKDVVCNSCSMLNTQVALTDMIARISTKFMLKMVVTILNNFYTCEVYCIVLLTISLPPYYHDIIQITDH